MDWLGKLASTALNSLVGGTLAILLTLFYMVATLLGIHLDLAVFTAMLTFAATYSGLAVTQFKIKRNTEFTAPPEIPSQDAATAAIGTAAHAAAPAPSRYKTPGLKFPEKPLAPAPAAAAAAPPRVDESDDSFGNED